MGGLRSYERDRGPAMHVRTSAFARRRESFVELPATEAVQRAA